MIRGLGTDVVHVHRIEQVLNRHGAHFLKRILSSEESITFADMAAPARRAEFVAGRFAAKEAIAKAFGCGLASLQPQTVNIAVTNRGLLVFLKGPLPAGVTRCDSLHVSISHSLDMAFAVAIWEIENQAKPVKDCT